MIDDANLWIWILLGLLLALPSLPGTLELLLLTLGGILPPRAGRSPALMTPIARIGVLIPAHDEAAGIAKTIASVRGCDPGEAGFDVIVIADNCTDATAETARRAGARVLERDDPARRGKGYALDFAFGALIDEGFDAFIIVDADTRVEANLVTEFRRLMREGAAAVQCAYLIDNRHAGPHARLLRIAWMAFNLLRPKGRERWGLSVGILGNGFGLTRATLTAVPYRAASVVEDLEYHLRLVDSGRRVVFAAGTRVWADAPTTRDASTSQRARWEGGRLRMIMDWTPRLLGRVWRGQHRSTEPLLELLLLPLAFHSLLLLLALLPPFWPTRIYALLGLMLVAGHVLAAIWVAGGDRRDLVTLFGAPFYIVWKLTVLRAIGRASRPDAAWVRTARDQSPSDQDRRSN